MCLTTRPISSMWPTSATRGLPPGIDGRERVAERVAANALRTRLPPSARPPPPAARSSRARPRAADCPAGRARARRCPPPSCGRKIVEAATDRSDGRAGDSGYHRPWHGTHRNHGHRQRVAGRPLDRRGLGGAARRSLRHRRDHAVRCERHADPRGRRGQGLRSRSPSRAPRKRGAWTATSCSRSPRPGGRRRRGARRSTTRRGTASSSAPPSAASTR